MGGAERESGIPKRCLLQYSRMNRGEGRKWSSWQMMWGLREGSMEQRHRRTHQKMKQRNRSRIQWYMDISTRDGWMDGWIDIDISENGLKYDSFENPQQ